MRASSAFRRFPIPTGSSLPARAPFLPLLALGLLASGCAAPGASPSGGGEEASDAVWESLRRPRPEPLAGAARVTVAPPAVLGSGPGSPAGALEPPVGLQELISAGLLRRRDVRFVERRRFAAATEKARRGEARPPGAPPVGRSPGAELVLGGTWAPAGPDSAVLELRLTDAESGRVVEAWRVTTPADADLVSLARTATAGLLSALDSLGRRPAWDDPGRRDAEPASYRGAGVSRAAVAAFLEGVAAEDAYRWEEARRAYQRAMELGGEGFFEPEVALARAARLRAGGSLGASQ